MPDPSDPTPDASNDKPLVTVSEVWGFFLVVVVGIVAGCCLEGVDAVLALAEAVFPTRHQ